MTPKSQAADLDLDALERPDAPEPFTVRLGGRTYTLLATDDVDYRELRHGFEAVARGEFDPWIRALLAEKDREAFFANRVPAFKLNELFRAYNAHNRPSPAVDQEQE